MYLRYQSPENQGARFHENGDVLSSAVGKRTLKDPSSFTTTTLSNAPNTFLSFKSSTMQLAAIGCGIKEGFIATPFTFVRTVRVSKIDKQAFDAVYCSCSRYHLSTTDSLLGLASSELFASFSTRQGASDRQRIVHRLVFGATCSFKLTFARLWSGRPSYWSSMSIGGLIRWFGGTASRFEGGDAARSRPAICWRQAIEGRSGTTMYIGFGHLESEGKGCSDVKMRLPRPQQLQLLQRHLRWISYSIG